MCLTRVCPQRAEGGRLELAHAHAHGDGALSPLQPAPELHHAPLLLHTEVSVSLSLSEDGASRPRRASRSLGGRRLCHLTVN